MANEPGTNELPSVAELKERAEAMLGLSRLWKARAKETPTRMLEPEAHEDALKAEKDLWVEGMSLLGKDPYCQIETPEHQRWTLNGKTTIAGRATLPTDTEFLISAPSKSVTEQVGEDDIKYTTRVDYAVTPNGVIMIERHDAETVPANTTPPVKKFVFSLDKTPVIEEDSKIKLLHGELRPPKGLGLEKAEIGRDEITNILQVLQTRVAHYPPTRI